MTVKYWSSAIPGDPNHKYMHAETGGIGFCKFPYSPYMSDNVGKLSAHISSYMFYYEKECRTVWAVGVFENPGNGKSVLYRWFWTKEKDAAFELAVQVMKGEDHEENRGEKPEQNEN